MPSNQMLIWSASVGTTDWVSSIEYSIWGPGAGVPVLAPKLVVGAGYVRFTF